MTSQTVSQGRKFAQVVRGAALVFLRDGYSAASVDDIALVAQVSKATLYSYFPDKGAMFQEAMRTETARLDFRLDLDLAPGPEILLPRIGMRIAEWLCSPRQLGLFRVLSAESPRFPALSIAYHDAVSGLLTRAVRPCLERWSNAGLVTIHDPEAATRHWIALSGLPLRDAMLMDGRPPPDRGAMAAHVASAATLFLRAHGPGVQQVLRRGAGPR